MAMQSLHIIAACTDRKRLPVSSNTQIRKLRSSRPLRSLVADWWKRLANPHQERIPARRLYAGDHWTAILKLPAQARNFETKLWVASAGYGLIEANRDICSYGATFSPGNPDSIGALKTTNGIVSSRNWWSELGKKHLKPKCDVRTVAQLARLNKKATLMVVAGPHYLMAMAEDIRAAAHLISNPKKLIIVSSPHPRVLEELGEHLVPSTARLQDKVGGARGALHARVAARIICEHAELNSTSLQAEYSSLLASLPPPPRFDRTPMTNKEVRIFISQQLEKKPDQAHSPMLRILRESGRRCEQSRFRELYNQERNREPHA